MLTCVEYIGYIAKFPGWHDKDTSMTLAMNRLNISAPRSAKKGANHLYTPYKPLMGRYQFGSLTIRPVHLSQADTIPLRYTESIGCTSSEDETKLKPWGILISMTRRKPDIALVESSTGLGEVLISLDMHTGERIWDFRIFNFF